MFIPLNSAKDDMSCLLCLFLLFLTSYAHSQSRPNKLACKSVPGSRGWPSPAEWSSLAAQLNGSLITPPPPALVCDPSHQSTYNQTQCLVVGENWFDKTFHTHDPVSVHYPNWQNDACLPTAVYNSGEGCDRSFFPTYVVNATTANDVALAVKFASSQSVRLSIKGTGHDFLGRSTSPGMSIWTHNLRGINVQASFQPSGCDTCERIPAITIAAGNVNCDVYAEAQKYGVIPVIGFDPDVGIGGYLMGGGHSPISGKFGLAVDNAIEMEVVTADGSLVIANDYKNSDLFWAMKGGGGSTYGVLVSATLKTFPSFPICTVVVHFASTNDEASQNNNSNWYSTLAFFHSQIPKFTDNDIFGYFRVSYQTSTNSTGPTTLMYFTFTGWGLNVSSERANALLAPFQTRLASESSLVGSVKVIQQSSIYHITSSCNSNSSLTVPGRNLILGSRLWDKKAVTDQTRLINTLRSLNPPDFSGLMISGPGVRDVTKSNRTSVTPAWRRTYLHITVTDVFDYRNTTQQIQASHHITYEQTAALRDHAPDMGCYINEADVNEPDHQKAFWGINYKKLLQMKRTYDPQGVFWCSVCVGAEDWNLNASTGQLCPVSKN